MCMPAVVQPQSPHETPVNLQLSWKKTESPTSKVFLPQCSQNHYVVAFEFEYRLFLVKSIIYLIKPECLAPKMIEY